MLPTRLLGLRAVLVDTPDGRILRAGSRDIEDIARVPRAFPNYWQLCDGPREKPAMTKGLLHARAASELVP